MTPQEMVTEFHERFGVPIYKSLYWPSEERMKLRLELIREEYQDELLPAVEQQDFIEIADALGDMVYVIYGMAIELGINLDACVTEIHRSNMSKLGEDGLPIYRESDNKVLKGPNYSPPDIKSIIFP